MPVLSQLTLLYPYLNDSVAVNLDFDATLMKKTVTKFEKVHVALPLEQNAWYEVGFLVRKTIETHLFRIYVY